MAAAGRNNCDEIVAREQSAACRRPRDLEVID
jgi:hypothetical protein